MKAYLITGVAGFIGASLTKKLSFGSNLLVIGIDNMDHLIVSI